MPKWVIFFLLVLPVLGFTDQEDFLLLMGKETPIWSYCKTAEDHRRMDFFQNLFENNQRAEKGEGIPPVFHFVWLGSAPYPEKAISRMERWIQLHPGCTFKLWADALQASPLPEVELVHPPYDLSEAFYEAIDPRIKGAILSFEILKREGGVYVSPQLSPFKALTPLMENHDFFCGLKELGPATLSSSVLPSPHMIAAKAGHSILQDTVAALGENRPSRAFVLGVDAGIAKEGNRDVVFPASYFSVAQRKASTYAAYHPSNVYQTSLIEQKIEGLMAKEAKQFSYLVVLVLASFLTLGGLIVYGRKSLLLSLLLLPQCLQANEEFFRLMGKGTQHWKFVTNIDELVFFSDLYEKGKDRLQMDEGPYRIPPVIHFIWLGPDPFPEESVENVRSWMALHPDWAVKFWTDRRRAPPCNDMQVCHVRDFSFQRLQSCYEESVNWGEKSDILRFEILAQEGGVYVDHDASCLQSFASLHRGYPFYCGLEMPHPPVAGNRITSGNGIIGGAAGHPVIEAVLSGIEKKWAPLQEKYRGKDGFSRTQLVMERTYLRLTEALKEHATEEDIVLPAAYFFAKKGVPSLYSRHYFANAWAEGVKGKAHTQKRIHRLLSTWQKRNQKRTLILKYALLLNLIVQAGIFVVLIKKRRRA